VQNRRKLEGWVFFEGDFHVENIQDAHTLFYPHIPGDSFSRLLMNAREGLLF
jgi:hypothetical protein